MALKGVDKVITELRKFGADIEKKIDAETEAIAFQIEGDAKKLAPKNFGKLAQSISHEKRKELQRTVTVNETYGAYIEFGTGDNFNAPAEFKEIASLFKKKHPGTFEKGLESIKAWCRVKGIPEEDAKGIFLYILGAGLNPRPFLYPAWQKGKKDYLKNLEALLSRTKKKI